MHIYEGFLPLTHALAWDAAAAAPAVISVRLIAKELDKKRENRVLLAASAAFLFTLSALRLPSITGSSSHPTGIAVGTYLFGPSAMPAMALITLAFQALLLAHGGLTTLGANLFSLGIVGPWAMWLVLRVSLRLGCSRDRSIFLSTVAGALATYVTTAGQLALAYPSPTGGYAASFAKFIGVFFITQVPISIAEGLVTVTLLRNIAADGDLSRRLAPAPSGATRTRGANLAMLTVVFATLLAAFGYANYTKAQGSDDQALSTIQALQPTYQPIARPMFKPSDALEPILFTAQAGTGLAFLGWAVVYFRSRDSRSQGLARPRHLHLHPHPHLSDIAFVNAWRHRNPWEKVLFGGGFLIIALVIPPFPWCIAIALIVTLAATTGARIPGASWASVLAVPLSFAVLTAVSLIVQFNLTGARHSSRCRRN